VFLGSLFRLLRRRLARPEQLFKARNSVNFFFRRTLFQLGVDWFTVCLTYGDDSLAFRCPTPELAVLSLEL